MEINKLHTPSKLAIIETARVYSLNPRLIKARAFAYFEAGFSPGETSLLLKTNVKPRSIQAYYSEWKELSQFERETRLIEPEPAGVLTASFETEQETQRMVSSNNEPATKGDIRIMELERQVAGLSVELKEARGSHTRFRESLPHVAGCPNCKADLEEYNQKIITDAIENLSVDAVRSLGFEKGAFPQKFTVPGS